MRNTIIAFLLVVVVAIIGMGVKVILLASPDADAKTIVGSSGISPEDILQNIPNRHSLPIAEHDAI